MNRLLIISGPSCVGKSPLHKALAKLYPSLTHRLKKLVLYNSRAPRPRERDRFDYHFRSRPFIQKLKGKKNFVVLNVRGDLQALDLEELKINLTKTNILFEGNPFIGKVLLTHPALTEIPTLSIFIAPLTRDEIIFIKQRRGKAALAPLVTEIMRRKLLRRTIRQCPTLKRKDIQTVERRARSAYKELREAFRYDYVVANHDGEDSENWNVRGCPLGDALRSVRLCARILGGKRPCGAEHWSRKLI